MPTIEEQLNEVSKSPGLPHFRSGSPKNDADRVSFSPDDNQKRTSIRDSSAGSSRSESSRKGSVLTEKGGRRRSHVSHHGQAMINAIKGASQNFAAGHLRAHDIVHTNTGTVILDATQRFVFGHPTVVVAVMLLMYVSFVVIFALIFLLFGNECFKLEGSFDFAAALWISSHVFSTIGFGNIAPRQTCAGAQIVVIIETFLSVLVVSALGGYVVKQFLRPLSRVRFSQVILLNNGRRRIAVDDDDERLNSVRTGVGYKYLTFRMVRQGQVQLRDVRVHVQAQYWQAGTTAFGDRDTHKGRVVNLRLEQDYFTTLEQLQVWHKLDESSPLWRMREAIPLFLDGIEISVSAFDMASLQKVLMYKRYEKSDLRIDVVFDNILTPLGKGKLQSDHSKIDNFTEEEEVLNGRADPKRNSRRRMISTDIKSSLLSSLPKLKIQREDSKARRCSDELQYGPARV